MAKILRILAIFDQEPPPPCPQERIASGSSFPLFPLFRGFRIPVVETVSFFNSSTDSGNLVFLGIFFPLFPFLLPLVPSALFYFAEVTLSGSVILGSAVPAPRGTFPSSCDAVNFSAFQ